MSKKVARARIVHYDDRGRPTRPAEHVNMRLCDGEDPQRFEISLRDGRVRRFRSIVVTRAEIERVLKANRRDRASRNPPARG